jgi:sulfur-carrier protein adenylyltransferase/sulfurtransferase
MGSGQQKSLSNQSDNMSNQRYIRQTILTEFGEKGQVALKNAKVLVIGAGGLGCPVLQYLVSMGVGEIGIVDDDVVSITNLHRQILFGQEDIGKSKVEVAFEKLLKQNNEINIMTYPTKINQTNAFEIISQYDIIADCSDNFTTRYIVNDACVLLEKPLVFAAVSAYEGQLAVFNFKMQDSQFSGNYRDIYPTMPKDGEIQNCAEAGILGVLPGILGTMQASEVIKIITGIGQPLVNKMLCYNMKHQQSITFEYKNVADKNLPKNHEEFLNSNYALTCDIQEIDHAEIDMQRLEQLMDEETTIFIDVRNDDERPIINKFQHKKIHLGELSSYFDEIRRGKVVFICQSGKRSLQAVNMARAHFNEDRFYSLKGGVMSNDLN